MSLVYSGVLSHAPGITNAMSFTLHWIGSARKLRHLAQRR